MVLFCRLSTHAIEFRDPLEADYLGSQTRRESLVPEHEIAAGYFDERHGSEVIRVADVKRLERTQLEGAVGHWKVMRTVMPAKVWETW